jgi:hypothetical protein
VRVNYQTNATVEFEVLSADQRVDIFQSALEIVQETGVDVYNEEGSSPNRERRRMSSAMRKGAKISSSFSTRIPLLKSRKVATKTRGVQLTCCAQDERVSLILSGGF